MPCEGTLSIQPDVLMKKRGRSSIASGMLRAEQAETDRTEIPPDPPKAVLC